MSNARPIRDLSGVLLTGLLAMTFTIAVSGDSDANASLRGEASVGEAPAGEAADKEVEVGAAESVHSQDETEWHGYTRRHFVVENRSAYVVLPSEAAEGRPWVWRARFPDYHPEVDIALLADGFHVGYVDVAGLFGSPRAMDIGNQFYEHVTREFSLASTPCLEGVSRGGLFVYNWAAQNPDRVASIYCDTPVCDFKSWPAGWGAGMGSPDTWKQCLQEYDLTEDQARVFRGNPIDHAVVIAEAKIPILHIVSENDRVVPPNENTRVLESRLVDAGHSMRIISVAEGTEQSNGHHFEHPAVADVVQFIREHQDTAPQDRLEILSEAQTVLFIGDSITYAGKYVEFLDAWLEVRLDGPRPVLINAGLPSETVSGLSEEGHAGGRFPRPDLAERLDRVLDETKPDLVIACYGINCGIYQPFDESRFESFQQGIHQLRETVQATGAQIIHVTPPCYDDARANHDFSYNGVLQRYSQWLVEQRGQDWMVIDLHTPMTAGLAERRETNPDFGFQPDGVHPNTEGHWFIATELIRWFGDEQSADAQSPSHLLRENEVPVELLELISQRMTVRRDAYLSAAGHLRPGIREGLDVEEAESQAADVTVEIQQLIDESDR